MAEILAVQGKNRILAFRMLKDAGTQEGAKLALQIEHEFSYERNNESTMTKDGPIINDGGKTTTLSLTAIASNDPVNKLLMEAFQKGEKLEIWEIDISATAGGVEGTYNAKYCRGSLRSWSDPAPVEGPVEIQTEVDIDGEPQEGTVKLTLDQIAQIQYTFRDLTVVTTVGA